MARYDRGQGRDLRPPSGGARTGGFAGSGAGPDTGGYGARGGPGADPFAGNVGAYRRWEPLWDGQDGDMRDGGFARGYGYGGGGAFIPDEAYRRHPELQRGRHEVDPWDGRGSGQGDRPMTDDEVARCVCEALERDSWLETDRIHVQVSEGVVTLTGEVHDYMEARYAWDDAWEADGVRGVISHLAVVPAADEEPHGDPMPQHIHTES